MITKELVEYINKKLEGGASKEQIKETLMSAGWQTPDVEEGFRVIYSDSITSERFVTLLDKNGYIKIKNIEGLFNENKVNAIKIGEKEYAKLEGWKALTINPKTGNTTFENINEIIRHKTNKNIFRVSQKFGGTRATEDHSIISKIDGEFVDIKPLELKRKKLPLIKINSIPKLKKIKEIDLFEALKDYFYISKYKGKYKKSYSKCNENFILFNWTNRKNPVKLKRFIKVGSKEFISLCRILGAYIAEGSSSTPETTLSRVGASISTSDVKWLNSLKRDYENLFLNARLSIIHSMKKPRKLRYVSTNGKEKLITYNDNTYKLQMMNQISAVFFKCLCGQRSDSKKLPDFIFHVSEKYQKLLLDEMIKGDGSRSFNKKLGYSKEYIKKNFRYETKSLQLACGLTLLLIQLDKKYHIRYRPSKKTYIIGTSDKNNLRLNTIVKKESYNGYVYDLSVNNSHIFVDSCGQILLHNTDSIFIELKDKTRDDALKLLEMINSELPSLMEMDIEDFYKRGLFVMKKSETSGAKKKYALIREDNTMKVRGFESIRRDWSYLAKEVQQKILYIILKDNNPKKAFDYVVKVIEDIKQKKIKKDKMVIRTQLKKQIKSYNLISPHVAIADKMKKQGMFVDVGSIISYIVAEGEGRISDKAILPEENKDYDPEYYINNQVIPSVERIFEALGYNIEELLKERSQKSLSHFLK